jgi:hypothetical protein
MMLTPPRPRDVQEAADDLQRRTLGGMARALDRMIYLASMRDYNTGLYYHEGLASRFTQEVASEATACCHREVFRQLVRCSLQEIVRQLEGYLASTRTNPREFVAAWKGLQPYRVAVPAKSDPLAAELLGSNIKVALAILEARLHAPPEEPGASPHRSPDR